jgi:hypothetical protein
MDEDEEDGAFVMYVDPLHHSPTFCSMLYFAGATLPMHWATISWAFGS